MQGIDFQFEEIHFALSVSLSFTVFILLFNPSSFPVEMG